GRITPAGAIAEFPIPTPGSFPAGITAGPDGNLWFAAFRTIGRITPAGVITEFPVPPPGDRPLQSTAAPAGPLCFPAFSLLPSHVGRITPAGEITEFTVPSTGLEGAITAGPDGNIWFAEFNGIVRLRPPFVSVSPGSGAYVTTERFDLTLLVNNLGVPVAG